MPASVNLSKIYDDIPVPLGEFLTLRGLEYEFTWIDEAVPAASSIFARVTSPVSKYTLVSFREVQMDQERGFYRFYVIFSGGTPGDAVPMVNLRGDTTIPSATVVEKITTPTFDEADKVVEVPMFGVAGQGNQPNSGELATAEAVRVVPPGATILLQMENASAATAYMRANFKQWEVLPSVIPAPGEV